MKARLPLLLPFVLLSVLALAGCAQNLMNIAAPTMALKTNANAPVVLGTYNKVAAVCGTSLYW